MLGWRYVNEIVFTLSLTQLRHRSRLSLAHWRHYPGARGTERFSVSPKPDAETAAGWRRTRHLREGLALMRYLDGTRTVPDAASMAGLTTPTAGWRVMAAIRNIAAEQPELLVLDERREGRTVYYTVHLLPESRTPSRRGRR